MYVLCYGKHIEIFSSKARRGAGDILCIFKSIAGNINEQALLHFNPNVFIDHIWKQRLAQVLYSQIQQKP